MIDLTEKQRALQDLVHEMKRDWDERARQNAKWFIDKARQQRAVRMQPSDKQFEETGKLEVSRLVLADLAMLTSGQDPKSMRILEIGCGIGRMTRELANIFGEVHATDVSAEMIKQARARLEGLSNVRLYETNGLDFAELPSGYFDLVFSAYVFQHVPSEDVIRANIMDAYRVLKPGGVLKFQTNSITSFDFWDTPKDTWVGASFPEAEIRRFAEESGAQLISIFGAGMQYCWTTLRKRPPLTGSVAQYAIAQPRIEAYGRADNPQIKKVPTIGDHAAFTLLVSGLNQEEVDANSLIVEISGQPVLPYYVGPVSKKCAALLTVEQASLDRLTQIEAALPSGEPSGQASVRVLLSSDEASLPVTIELCEPQPVIPKIIAVLNASDLGTDIYARGVKSCLVIHVEGLDEAADTGNVRVQIGQRIIKPGAVSFVSRKGVYQVDAQLPADTAPGVTDLRLHFGSVQSPAAPLHIR
jgi:ubiquinone/menaquinone biosynthesis C-methylase UbiE